MAPCFLWGGTEAPPGQRFQQILSAGIKFMAHVPRLLFTPVWTRVPALVCRISPIESLIYLSFFRSAPFFLRVIDIFGHLFCSCSFSWYKVHVFNNNRGGNGTTVRMYVYCRRSGMDITTILKSSLYSMIHVLCVLSAQPRVSKETWCLTWFTLHASQMLDAHAFRTKAYFCKQSNS